MRCYWCVAGCYMVVHITIWANVLLQWMQVNYSFQYLQYISREWEPIYLFNTGPINSMLTIGACNPWVGWVLCNAVLHIGWVALLTICQTYQIVWLGMTTNERMNRGRYRHFQATGGKSPFNRGPVKNLADFFECSCFGLVQPVKTDWMTYFELEKSIEHEPLLRATDNYQYV